MEQGNVQKKEKRTSATENTPLLPRRWSCDRPNCPTPTWLSPSAYVSLLACVVIFAEGYDYGVLNGVIVRIADEYHFPMVELSLIVSSTPIGFAIGNFICGPLVDHLGRVLTLKFICAILVVGPLIMSIASSFIALVLARFFCGIGMGGGILVVSLYIAELTPAKSRGSLLCLENFCLDLGVVGGFLANVLLRGVHNDWRIMLALGAAVPFIMFIAICCGALPESPRWLLARGRILEANQVLDMYLPGEPKPAVGGKDQGDFATWSQVLWPEKRYRNQVFTGTAVLMFQAATGVIAVTYYSSMLLTRQDGLAESTAFLFTFWMGVARLLVDIAVIYLVDQWGRKKLFFLSSILLVIAFLGMAIVHASEACAWCRAIFLGLTLAAFSVGWGPLAFLYASEVFPTQFRGKAMAVGLMFSRLFIFLTTFLFPLLIEWYGARGTSLIFMFINLLSAIFVLAQVVETKNQTLEEISF